MNTHRPQLPFELDPFQREAIGWIDREHSVLVSAPTGAGKTLIAEWAIERARQRSEGVIYTAPVKALSNQKFRDFKERCGEDIGIVTGDVSINPHAPFLIMTTEIYRNSLFESSPRIQNLGWIILDEIHYLNDPERGTVWEEALMFTPPSVRILGLSATVPNIQELAEWIGTLHGNPMAVVIEHSRPVPLKFAFQCQGKIFDNKHRLLQEGYQGRSDWRLSHHHRRHPMRFLRAKPNRHDSLFRHLQARGQLPAIYFVFGRKRACRLAEEAMQFDFLNDGERREIIALYEKLLSRFQLTYEKSAQELWQLVSFGIAYHHAGMLPTLKEVVEQLFTSRLLKLIFTTETFALGINMPARAVVFDELQKFYGTGFKNLTTRDFYQMAGRAGRRGMDECGFVYCRLNPHDIAFHEVERILYGKSEPILSQFNAAYATILNLFRVHGRDLVKIYPRSLHYFQASKKKRRQGYEMIERKIGLLEELGYISDNSLTSKGEFAASLFGYELLLSEMRDHGVLETLDEISLPMLLSAMVFEPRKADASPPRTWPKHLDQTVTHHMRIIHDQESKHRVRPYTKPPHFDLARAMEAWAKGKEFDELFRLVAVDEGELVRNFRMVIQLLRELEQAALDSEKLKTTARRALDLIKRDVVDAEKQLRA